MSKTAKGGILLMAAGVVLLLVQLDVIPGDYFLLLLGAGFCLAYALFGGRKEYGSIGFLIPGTILLAIGVFAGFETRVLPGSPGVVFLSLLGLSFLAVFLVHTFWFKEVGHGGRFWPLYPFGGLVLLAVLSTARINLGWTAWQQAMNYIWVAALIVTGLWLLLGRGKKEGR